MKILFLSSVLPHSRVVSGFAVIYHRIKLLLERGHQIGLAAFLRDEDTDFIPEMRPMFCEMELVETPRRSLPRRIADSVACPVPSDFRDLMSDEMRATIGLMVKRSNYDVVIAEFSPMGQYLCHNPSLPAVRRIISCHTCYTTAARDRIKVQGWGTESMKTLLSLASLQSYEFNMYRSADHVLTLTPEERVDLHHYASDLRVSVSPYGVDTKEFKPRPGMKSEECLVFTGFFQHLPNQDAVMWFVQKVWPELKTRFPKLVFYVVGRSPTRAMREMGRKDPRIIVTGETPDIADYLAKARIYVCPARMGKGLRGKILQAMAAGVPVVSTTLGAEGIVAQSGHNIFLANTPHTMVESISLLLREESLRLSMSKAARDLVVSRYSWPHCVDLLEEVLYRVME